MTTPAPKVTVLMAAYNAAEFLSAAIDSILAQSLADFEFLIVDDGSTDGSGALVEGYRDPRIRLVQNERNLGLIASLNLGLELARGSYLARMDADDISLPERLERQVAFLDAHPDVGVCGTWLEAFDGARTTLWSPPLDDQEIKANLYFESVIYHPTVMMRTPPCCGPLVRYSTEYRHAEDYELWSRLSSSCRFANIGKVLLRYRLHGGSIGCRQTETQVLSAGKVRRRQLAELGLDPDTAQCELHDAISRWHIEADSDYLRRVHDWLLVLQQANARRGSVSPRVFDRVLARRWYDICLLATPIGRDAYRFFYRSPLSDLVDLPLRHKLVFGVRAMLGKR